MGTAQTTSMDQKVVVMKFDNKDFEKNTRETMSTLDKLKQKLKFNGAEKGIENINESIKKTDMGPISKSIVKVEESFNGLQVAAIAATENITKSALRMASSFLQSVSGINNVTRGWSKLADKTGNVQTLINSTGLGIEEINGYLDQLMWYSDETSYSFTDMTSALANMTATGGDIKKLVPMIEGIANATAFAGKGAAEFSRVIYNLNQSYGAGALTLMDWKSVQNAGAASKQLKEELIKAGEALGTIKKKGSVTIGNFNETLKDHWATTKVMEVAFGKFSAFTEAVYKKYKELNDEGYTTSDIIRMLSSQFDSLSVKGFKAAQEAKSWKEAVDATLDASSSKWMEVFETIFGNYDEQKRIFTDLANIFYDWFVEPIEKVKDLLSGAFKGTVFVKVFDNVTSAVDKMNKSLNSASTAIEKATLPLKEYQKIVDKIWNGDYKNQPYRKKLLEQAGYNYQAFQYLVNLGADKNGHYTGRRITMDDVNKAQKLYGNLLLNNKKVTQQQVEKLNDLSKAMYDVNNLTDEQLDKLVEAGLLEEEQVKYYQMLRDGAKKYGTSISELVGWMKKANAHDLIFGKTRKDKNGEDLVNTRDKKTGKLIDETKEENEILYETEGILQNITATIDNLREIIASAWEEIFKYSPIDVYMLAKRLQEFTAKIRKVTQEEKFVKNLTDTFKGLFSIIKLITTVIGGAFKVLWTIISTIFETFGGTVLDVTGFLGNLTSTIAKLTDTGSPLINFITEATKVVAGFIKEIYNWFASHVDLNGIFEYIKQKTSKFIGQFKDWITELKEAYKEGNLKEFFISTLVNIINTIKRVAKNGFSGFIDWLVSGFGNPTTEIGKWFQGLGGAKEGKTLGKYIVDGLIEGIIKSGSKIGEAIKFVFDIIVGTIKELFNINSPSKVTEELGENVGDGLYSGIVSSFGKLAESIPKLLTTIIEKLSDFIKELNLTKIGLIVFGAIGAKILLDVAKGIKGFGTTISYVNDVIDSFRGVLDSFKGVLNAIKAKLFAEIFKTIAISILMLVAALIAIVITIKKAGAGTVWQAVAIMGGMVIALIALFKIMTKNESMLKKGSIATIQLAALAVALGLSMLLIARAMTKIASIDSIGIDHIALVLEMIIGFIVSVAIMVLILNKSTKKTFKSVNDLAILMLAIGAAFILMAKSISIIGAIPDKGITQATSVLGALIVMIGAIALVSKVAKEKSSIGGLETTLLSIAGLFLAMTISLKILSKISPADLLKSVVTMSAMTIMIMSLISVLAAISTISKDSNTVIKMGGTLLAIGGMFMLMALSMKIIGSLEPAQIAKGLVVLTAFSGLITGFVILLSSISTQQLKGLMATLFGISSVILALTISILLLGILPTDMVAKGTAFVSILTLLVAGLVKAAAEANSGGNVVSASRILIYMTTLIGTITASLFILSLLDTKKVLGSVIAMGSILGALVAVCMNLNKFSIGKKAKSNMAWMVVILFSMTLFMTQIAKIDAKSALPNAIAIAVLLGAMTLVVYALEKMGSLSGKALLGLLGLALLLPIMWASIELLKSMDGIKNAEKNALILSAFLGAMTLILLLTAAVGAIYLATMGIGATGILGLLLILGLCIIAVDILNGVTLNEQSEKNADILVNFLGKLTDILLKISIMAPLLAIAVPALGILSVLIIAMMAFATVVGVLMTKFPSLQEFLNKGMPILIGIASSLGEMIGAFVGNMMLNISKILPEIGTNLSLFMLSAMPFIEGAKKVTKKTSEGVSFLALAVIELAAAQILSSIAKIISFGSDFSSLGTTLSKFIENANGFLDKSSKIDKNAAEGAKNIAAAIMYLTAGQLIQQLTKFLKDDIDFEEFAKQMPLLATGIVGFAENLGTFGDDQLKTITVACDAIKKLSDVAKDLPGEDGLWQKLFGGNSLAHFASEMEPTATALVTFINTMTNGKVDDSKLPIVETACKIIKTLADTAKNLPGEGSWWGKIFGGNTTSLGDFATQIESTGTGLAKFINKFSKVKEGSAEVAKAAAAVILSFAELGKLEHLDTLGDMLVTFTSKLPDSATNLKNFIDAVAEYDAGTIDSARNNCINIAKAISEIIKSMSKSVKDNSSTLVSEFKSLIQTIVDTMKSKDIIDKFVDAGKNFVEGLKNGIDDKKSQDAALASAKRLADKIKKTVKVDSFDEHSPSRETYEMGKFFDQGLTNGILDYAKYAYKAAASVGDEAKNGLTNAVSKISDAIDSDIDTQPTIRPVLDLSNIDGASGLISSMLNGSSMQLMSNLGSISYGINSRKYTGTNNDVVDAIDKLRQNLGSTGDTYNINGVTYDDGSEVSNAVSQLIRAINVERRV